MSMIGEHTFCHIAHNSGADCCPRDVGTTTVKQRSKTSLLGV